MYTSLLRRDVYVCQLFSLVVRGVRLRKLGGRVPRLISKFVRERVQHLSTTPSDSQQQHHHSHSYNPASIDVTVTANK